MIAMHPIFETCPSLLRARLALAPVVLLVFSLNVAGAASGNHPNTTEWRDLFSPDLSNAIQQGPWSLENRVLVAKDHGALWTKDAYGNFILDLEFKVAPAGNSGVFLRSTNPRNALSALEIQVHEFTDDTKYGMVGALYDAKPPSKSVGKPAGEWNHYTITCRDSRLSLVFNGELVLDADLNDWKIARQNPDGTPNKFPVAFKDFARKGQIGFQGLHGKQSAPVWYRNIKIKTLN